MDKSKSTVATAQGQCYRRHIYTQPKIKYNIIIHRELETRTWTNYTLIFLNGHLRGLIPEGVSDTTLRNASCSETSTTKKERGIQEQVLSGLCSLSLFSSLTDWMLITWPGRAAASAAGVVELSKRRQTVNHIVIVGLICKYTCSIGSTNPRAFVFVKFEGFFDVFPTTRAQTLWLKKASPAASILELTLHSLFSITTASVSQIVNNVSLSLAVG